MFRKYISLTLIGLLLNLAFYSTAKADAEKDAKFAEKVKADISKLGSGRDDKVEIKLKDGTKLKGYLKSVRELSFILMIEETGATEEIEYSQVRQVKDRNLSASKKFLLRVFIIGVLLIPIVGIGISKDGV